MAFIEITFDDGIAARWKVSQGDADLISDYVIRNVAEPDTIILA